MQPPSIRQDFIIWDPIRKPAFNTSNPKPAGRAKTGAYEKVPGALSDEEMFALFNLGGEKLWAFLNKKAESLSDGSEKGKNL
ncbi:unnamed protein product [Clonostachys rosea f. rosea IK726]|uniref:Uncharacterized protein n=2 Tax=Clonostachys rosea f. rosea IK726 TaxID=1349383 RepID=A0ACA9UGB1_BIOOC|nr:unnamed protein product [Clonostachys rosea f. rosea IK726]CAG9952821.1 unnamed protein product [Clonostachys rosea f. rosea IK726]